MKRPKFLALAGLAGVTVALSGRGSSPSTPSP